MNKELVHIIDDNASICDALGFLFESFNYKVKLYQNPLDFLRQDTTQLKGCVIVDLLMPEINGLELIKRLRKKNNRIGIIGMSGNSSHDLVELVLQEGAQAFLPKPFNTDDLLNKVHELLNRQGGSILF